MKLVKEAVVLIFLKVCSSNAETAFIGSPTYLECPLSLIAYYWYKKFIGGTKLLKDGDKYYGTSNKTLTIKIFELTDEGFYRCEGFTIGGIYSMSHLIQLFVAVDGGWSTWNTWDVCTSTCGTGQHRRRRYCNNPTPANGGSKCQGGDYEYRSCSPSLCPVDTGWSAWDSWGVCNVTCGSGQQSRRRYCKNYDSAKGGAYCQGEEYDFNSCLLSSCLDPEHQQSTNISIVVGTVSGVLVVVLVIILVVIYAKRRWYNSKKKSDYDIPDIRRVQPHFYMEHMSIIHTKMINRALKYIFYRKCKQITFYLYQVEEPRGISIMFRLFLILFNLSYSINAFLLVAGTRRVVKQLSVTNGGPYGTWKTAEFCPVGYFAVGFNVKVEPKSSAGIFADNTALNSILLRCQDGSSITSGEGAFGHWQAEAGCGYDKDGNPNFLTSFDLQVEPDQGVKDDSSANWIRFKCRDFDTENSHQLDVPPGKFYWGTYGSWSEACPLHSAICGIQTRVEKERSSLYGNTALNDVILFCCNE